MEYLAELELIRNAMESSNPEVQALLPIVLNLTNYSFDERKFAMDTINSLLKG